MPNDASNLFRNIADVAVEIGQHCLTLKGDVAAPEPEAVKQGREYIRILLGEFETNNDRRLWLAGLNARIDAHNATMAEAQLKDLVPLPHFEIRLRRLAAPLPASEEEIGDLERIAAQVVSQCDLLSTWIVGGYNTIQRAAARRMTRELAGLPPTTDSSSTTA